MQQEVVLALLAKEPSYGYELRARLRHALGPLGEAMNDGQVYVTLSTAGEGGAGGVGAGERLGGPAQTARCTGSPRTAKSASPSGWPR